MGDINEYGNYNEAWCPGCGNFDILQALKQTLAELDIPPHKAAIISGIGQAAKMPHYITANGFNGLHGRALSAAQAVKIVNPELTVLVTSGDGCTYAEGGNHFLAAIRRNVDMVAIVHDNQVYGLTKGQASPTTQEGQITKAQPFGVTNAPFNPVGVAVVMRANFVARAFSGNVPHLVETIKAAIAHPGFALVDVLQPCVSFNKVNTFGWYKKRCYELGEDYDPTNREKAIQKADEFSDKIPIGVLYTNNRPAYGGHLPKDLTYPLGTEMVDSEAFDQVVKKYS
ncbi:2-oxoacid:ferredoxin oxidoreductase subunit beta [Halodesulfovibrio marinisediminis]|uniref:2-oxoglutarate ferredoxin oxidoreductase subunit beta n=1 Tax=Halodesulfovibrio marinisediminis DSM 17456 TaxID=1121457 RepID=A0A1N6J8P3_9BACT|nr:2-oxoacid:ferredoxin oxidoreductase subunit beta [Halodesulfovibrio marinisediminis]SIO40529.1 2-oxoglutarate ferredoxin oxidoreductase subunit beta [Halodesulfovibrio marinisediminis DSM 17456]